MLTIGTPQAGIRWECANMSRPACTWKSGLHRLGLLHSLLASAPHCVDVKIIVPLHWQEPTALKLNEVVGKCHWNICLDAKLMFSIQDCCEAFTPALPSRPCTVPSLEMVKLLLPLHKKSAAEKGWYVICLVGFFFGGGRGSQYVALVGHPHQQKQLSGLLRCWYQGRTEWVAGREERLGGASGC